MSDTELRRSDRHQHISAHLKDYYVGEDYGSTTDDRSTRLCARLGMERDLLIGDINHNCDKVRRLIDDCGSRTTLRRNDAS